jgi:hypothetical protein
MSVFRFTVPGHSTRRELAVYIIVGRRVDDSEFFAYVGKTGDNRAGCNPVISRAGNHFSYNKIHSQVRNKVTDPHLFDHEYFYVTFDTYDDDNRNIDMVNEMERATNRELQKRLSPGFTSCLKNPYKGSGFLPAAEKEVRRQFMTSERQRLVSALVDAVVDYIESFNAEFAHR